MKLILFLIVLPLFIFSCTQSGSPSNALNRAWLDSIIKNSDSSYEKPYYRTDFVTAVYYVNKRDSIVCQLMKDSAGIIRQISIANKDVRTFFAQYYKNGQLQADLSLDEFGQYHGAAIYYFEDGSIQSRGSYLHGLKTGQWNNYNAKGKLISVENYDKNGQAISK